MSRLKISEISDAPQEGTGKQIHFKHDYTEVDTFLRFFRSKANFIALLTSAVVAGVAWEKVC